METAIPWKSLGIEAVHDGLSLGFNLSRHRINMSENSSWVPLDGSNGNCNPRRFGLLVMGSEAPHVVSVQRPISRPEKTFSR